MRPLGCHEGEIGEPASDTGIAPSPSLSTTQILRPRSKRTRVRAIPRTPVNASSSASAMPWSAARQALLFGAAGAAKSLTSAVCFVATL